VLEFSVRVMGNGAKNVDTGFHENPGSCVNGDILTLVVDHDFGYENQVAVTSFQLAGPVIKIGHVMIGHQEIFVKKCLEKTEWRVRAVCVTDSDRGYKSSALVGFEMKVVVTCPGGTDKVQLHSFHQQFLEATASEIARKDAALNIKKKKPTKSVQKNSAKVQH